MPKGMRSYKKTSLRGGTLNDIDEFTKQVTETLNRLLQETLEMSKDYFITIEYGRDLSAVKGIVLSLIYDNNERYFELKKTVDNSRNIESLCETILKLPKDAEYILEVGIITHDDKVHSYNSEFESKTYPLQIIIDILRDRYIYDEPQKYGDEQKFISQFIEVTIDGLKRRFESLGYWREYEPVWSAVQVPAPILPPNMMDRMLPVLFPNVALDCYDVINVETVSLSNFLGDDPFNFVIQSLGGVNDENHAMGANLEKMLNDIKNNDDKAIFFNCGDRTITTNPANARRPVYPVDLTRATYRIYLNNMNVIVPVSDVMNVKDFFEKGYRVFVVLPTDTVFKKTASRGAAYITTSNAIVSADHCQQGTDKVIYRLLPHPQGIIAAGGRKRTIAKSTTTKSSKNSISTNKKTKPVETKTVCKSSTNQSRNKVAVNKKK